MFFKGNTTGVKKLADVCCELNLPSVLPPGFTLVVPRILPGLLVAPAACGPHLGLQQTKQFCRALWQMESQSLMDPNYQGPLPAAVYLLTLPPFTPAPRAPLASPASLWNSSSDGEYKTSPEDECHTCWSWITPVITCLRKRPHRSCQDCIKPVAPVRRRRNAGKG